MLFLEVTMHLACLNYLQNLFRTAKAKRAVCREIIIRAKVFIEMRDTFDAGLSSDISFTAPALCQALWRQTGRLKYEKLPVCVYARMSLSRFRSLRRLPWYSGKQSRHP